MPMHVDVAVVGSGFSAVALALALIDLLPPMRGSRSSGLPVAPAGGSPILPQPIAIS